MKRRFFSKKCTATPRPAEHFWLGSEVSTETKDTVKSQSETLGSLLESVGTISGEGFNFWACNVQVGSKNTIFFKKLYSNAQTNWAFPDLFRSDPRNVLTTSKVSLDSADTSEPIRKCTAALGVAVHFFEKNRLFMIISIFYPFLNHPENYMLKNWSHPGGSYPKTPEVT